MTDDDQLVNTHQAAPWNGYEGRHWPRSRTGGVRLTARLWLVTATWSGPTNPAS
ncbi:hypothetical protein ACIHCQ_09000 [Streptomyces sp. NPDC052236]|uniref:hypothetical protein n=1 Tax=Streptomyces sp. NPDC052236 TaxID=3365686 RepID=UPI0037CF23D3